MLTKTAFFALLNDANKRIGVTAHIKAVEEANGTQSLIISQNSAPNSYLSNHKSHTTTFAAFKKYNAWLNEWFEAATAKAEVELAHAEALEMDKQATHFRREQAALTERVRAIMTPAESDEDRLNREYHNTMTGIETMNKAKAKQQQTPANLPKPQLIDVLRAALRTQAAATDQHIEAVGDMTETQLRKAINSITAKGVRVTAHLVKAKRYGYGALTFGVNGQLPPGSYHALQVKSMKDARETATRYGAMMWNF